MEIFKRTFAHMSRYTCLLLLSFLIFESFYAFIPEGFGSCITEKEYKNFECNGLIDHLEKKKLQLNEDIFLEIARWQESYFFEDVEQLIKNIYKLKKHNKTIRNPLAMKYSVNCLPYESEEHFILPKPILDKNCIIYTPVYDGHGNIIDHWLKGYNSDRENDSIKQKNAKYQQLAKNTLDLHKKLLKQIPWAHRITIEENLEDMRRKRAVETQMIVWHAIQSIQRKPSVFKYTCKTFHDIIKDKAYVKKFLEILGECANDGLCIRFFHIRPEIIVAYHHGNTDEKSFFGKKTTEIIFDKQNKNNDRLKIFMQTRDNVLRYRPIEIATKEKMYYLDRCNLFSLLPLSFLFPLTIPGHFLLIVCFS